MTARDIIVGLIYINDPLAIGLQARAALRRAVSLRPGWRRKTWRQVYYQLNMRGKAQRVVRPF